MRNPGIAPSARRLALAAAVTFGAAAAAQEPIVLEVEAGPHARRDVPVEWALPPELAGEHGFRMFQLEGEEEVAVPVQVAPDEPPRVAWIVAGSMEPESRRRYRLAPANRRSRSVPARAVHGPGVWSLQVGRREVTAYRERAQDPPQDVDPVFARSGYLHPLRTPSGRAVTADFPPAHLHHHGIWAAWTRARFAGRAVDFWNSAARQGRVVCVEADGGGGAVFAWVLAEHRHELLTERGAELVAGQAALRESWEVRVWNLEGASVVDLVSEQACAGEAPLELEEYHYGGFGFRGPLSWEGDAVAFLTSEGHGRFDGHATRVRWCAIWGEVDGAPATVALLGHPGSFRAPQPVRIHPSEPFFCWAPCQLGPFEIAPEHPLVSRYRFVALDGEPDADELERLWRDYAEPPRVRVVE